MKSLMKNKRGILLPESLRLILALICLVLLIFLAVRLYGLFLGKTEIEQAKASLEQISGIMDNLEDGESAKYLVTGPKGWYLVYYNFSEIEKSSKWGIPRSCGNSDCLCFCPTWLGEKDATNSNLLVYQPVRGEERGGWIDFFYNVGNEEWQGLRYCDNYGVCENVNNVFISQGVDYMIWGRGLEWFFWTYRNGTVPWIGFNNVPNEIILSNSKKEIEIKKSENFV